MENKDFLQVLLVELKKPLPAKWRVQSYSKRKPQATVMAYIDARDAMEALDTHAIYGWHRKHYVLDRKMYCEVGIVMPDGTTQWRSDCGTESNTDAEKGQSSDSFKRACVNFGIGRFLYDLPVEYIVANEIKGEKNYPYPVDQDGKQIWDLTKYINDKKVKPTSPKIPANKPETLPFLVPNTDKWKSAIKALNEGYTLPKIKEKYQITPENEIKLQEDALNLMPV
jgi:hypothetical protein